MPRLSILTVFALIVVLAGCTAGSALTDGPPAGAVAPDGVALSADQTAYVRGATARLTLRNGAAAVATTGVLECAQIETWQRGAWATSAVGNDRACIMIARILQPGETMTGGVVLDVPAGTYRLAQSVSLEGADTGTVAATAPFRVE